MWLKKDVTRAEPVPGHYSGGARRGKKKEKTSSEHDLYTPMTNESQVNRPITFKKNREEFSMYTIFYQFYGEDLTGFTDKLKTCNVLDDTDHAFFNEVLADSGHIFTTYPGIGWTSLGFGICTGEYDEIRPTPKLFSKKDIGKIKSCGKGICPIFDMRGRFNKKKQEKQVSRFSIAGIAV